MAGIYAAIPGFLGAVTALIWLYVHSKNHPTS